MLKKLFVLTLAFSNCYALNIFNRNNNASSTNTDQKLISSQTKQAAKTAACFSIAKGGCLAVKGSKYLINEISSSPSAK